MGTLLRLAALGLVAAVLYQSLTRPGSIGRAEAVPMAALALGALVLARVVTPRPRPRASARRWSVLR
jgi:hypothetical protein